MAIAIAKLKRDGEFEKVTSKIEFNVVELSDLMGWDSSPVKKELKLLEWNLGQSSCPLATDCFVVRKSYHFVVIFSFIFIVC